MVLSLVPAVRKTFSFNNAAGKDIRLSDLIENQRLLELRYPQANMVLNGRMITCQCCRGNGCEGCSWEGQIWEEGLWFRGLRRVNYAIFDCFWDDSCKVG
jgi:hypothetical protein